MIFGKASRDDGQKSCSNRPNKKDFIAPPEMKKRSVNNTRSEIFDLFMSMDNCIFNSNTETALRMCFDAFADCTSGMGQNLPIFLMTQIQLPLYLGPHKSLQISDMKVTKP